MILSIAEISGIIAAAVMIVQYLLPTTLILILIKHVGIQNTAVSWSVINRTISTTLWPHLVRADAVSFRHVSRTTVFVSWSITISAALLVIASVLAPLGLYEVVIATEPQTVEFTYVRDQSPWGRTTMSRPNMAFSRICETGLTINCPGQYQGIFMNETRKGSFESVETDENSTINSTVPANFTNMFYSATEGPGNTLSGLFDIQYRGYELDSTDIRDKGQVLATGVSRSIENLVQHDSVLLKEGLIVDMTDTPGIGFRNHTVPLGLTHGGTWSEDLTWIEPMTSCVDTNLSVEVRVIKTAKSFSPNYTYSIIDSGAFLDLDLGELETRPWLDNQTLDLFGRAYKAARMYNVLSAATLNVSLPLKSTDPGQRVIPVPKKMESDNMELFTNLNVDKIGRSEIAGLGGSFDKGPRISNASYVPYYPDGWVKLLAMNYSAITQICRGYYDVAEVPLDRRSNNITYPVVDCGLIIGSGLPLEEAGTSPLTYTGRKTYQRKIYMCATGVKASIKTVDFRYNSTDKLLSKLEVTSISDKKYPNEESKPLWAVEHSYDKRMRFDGLWGLVNDSYKVFDGFYTQRSAHLWLPTSPQMTLNFGSSTGFDSLPAPGSFIRHVSLLYGKFDLFQRDYSGENDMAIQERYRRLSWNSTLAAQIPSLIMTDGLAGDLIGTKTSFAKSGHDWPASMGTRSGSRGYPQAKVLVHKRVVRYDFRYAIPGLIVVAMLLLVLAWAAVIAILNPTIFKAIRNIYNQTSTGRLATNLLLGDQSDPNRPTSKWVEENGRLLLSIGPEGGLTGDVGGGVVLNEDASTGQEGFEGDTKARSQTQTSGW
jgi:hypothetical protein